MRKWIAIGLSALMISSLTGCTVYLKDSANDVAYVKEMAVKQTDKASSAFKELDLTIQMGVGDLKIGGDSENLVEGKFEYSDKGWEPIVEERELATTKIVKVSQPSVKISRLNNTVYNWNFKIAEQIPTDLKLESGVGRSKLDLRKTAIEKLDIEMGVGEVELNLDQNYAKDVDVSIQGGVGNLEIILPKDMGVKAKVQGGLKTLKANGFIINEETLTNSAYKEGEPCIELDIQAGIGNISLKMAD